MRLIIFIATFLFIFPIAIGWQVIQVTARAQESLEKLNQLHEIEDRIFGEAIERAFAQAPPGKTKYQLRGDAQLRAQSLLNFLTTKYDQPQIRLPGIVFRPVLTRAAAGLSSNCQQSHRLELSELLFYANYDAYMREIIPHEVAHIGVCLKFGDYLDVEKDDHDERWESVMSDLGFYNPTQYEFHDLNMEPTHEAMRRIRVEISDLNAVDF